MLVLMLSAVFGASAIALKETEVAEQNRKSRLAFYSAEAALEDAVYRVKTAKNLGSSVTLVLNNATSTVTIANVNGEKEIVSSAAHIASIRALKARLSEGMGISFNYGLQVGYLGLEMKNQSKVIGSVYSNGSIKADPNTQITGDAWVAGGTALVADQSQLAQSDNLLIRDIASHRDAAQSFVPTITAEIRKIALLLKKIGTSIGTMTVRIVADNNGNPDNGNSLASAGINENRITSDYSWMDLALNSNAPLLKGKKYWLVLDTDGSSATKYYILGGVDDSGYANGTFLYSNSWNDNSPVWTATGKDSAFKIFMGNATTSIDGANIGENGIGDAHANTIKNSDIEGKAYCQTTSNTTSADGNNICNLANDPNPLDFPISDGQIAQFKLWGDNGGACVPPLCDANNNLEVDGQATTTTGPIKINGNMRLENKAALIMTGTIHVAGNLTLKNQCSIRLDQASYGNNAGVIVVDGTVSVEEKCSLFGSGDPESYLMIITTNQGIESPPAFRIKNQSDTDPNTKAILYASEGAMEIDNKVKIKEAIGQKLRIQNKAEIEYEKGLANVNFSSGPSGGWEIISWEEIVP